MSEIRAELPQLDEIASLIERHGNAYFKVISANDLGLTGSHQKGFYLSKMCWEYFTPQPPVNGINSEYSVSVDWDNGQSTASAVKWYGRETRSEYRLTRFNRIRGFYALLPEALGSVLCLIRVRDARFRAFVISSDDDIEYLASSFGFNLALRGWAILDATNPEQDRETQAQACQSSRIAELVPRLGQFPDTRQMSLLAQQVVDDCRGTEQSPDARILSLVAAEYELFRAIEGELHREQITGGFEGVDEFLILAQTITQRRKSRAGRSLELHVESILRDAQLEFQSQPQLDGTQPDLILPSATAYYEASDPDRQVMVVAVKTTCRDRWRQVLEEAPRVSVRYLLTLQRGISSSQMRAIADAGIQLVVPQPLQEAYASEDRERMISVSEFLEMARGLRPQQPG
ncbi:putative restriction endonuclease type II, EcoRII-like [metagenome]|uniref:Putative restriction endonuclease type II, EcoRII-like n=1 Tax=metagenome TaxID=256318 RepID=A0A2P2C5L9_9ZZZZ